MRARGLATSPLDIGKDERHGGEQEELSFLTLASASMSVPSTRTSPAPRSASGRRCACEPEKRYRRSAAARVQPQAACAGAASVHGASSPIPTDFSDLRAHAVRNGAP